MKVLNKFLKNGTGNYVEGVVNGRTGSGPVRSTSCETPHNAFKIASWNIGTMRGRSSEIVETITRRNVDLCCVQEVRWRGASARHITGKDYRYKFFWVGNNQGTSGVGVLLAEKWVDKLYDIKRLSDRIMLIKLLVGEAVLKVLSVYAPQTGLEESTKDAFYDSLQTVISELPDKEIVIPCGDWNGHVGREAAGYEGVHGGSGYGECNANGDRVLEFAVANDFVIGNTFFVKRDSHLITYQSGNAKTQIDFILLRKRNLKMAKDIKVIPSEECVPQHKLLICELRLRTPKPHPKPFSPKLCYWKLKEPTVQEEYEWVFAFVDLENAFDRIPRKVIWWAMRKLGIEEWIVRFVQAMYNNTRSRVRVNNTYSDEFGLKVGVHQGSVLSPVLFVIVLEALSREFHTGTPWELLYADDLVISGETEVKGFKMKLNEWKIPQIDKIFYTFSG